MKWFSLFIFLILQSFKSVPIDSEESRLINPVKYWMDKLKKEIIELITPLINLNEDDNINNNTFEKFDVLYDLIESLDQECFDFIIDLYFGEKDLLQNAGKILFKEGGFIQISVGIENDCISDGTYIMFTSNDTIIYFVVIN